MENWTIGVWFIHPVPKTGAFHTLIQGVSGVGGVGVINPEGTKVGLFDEATGEFHTSSHNLRDIKHGWRHLAITKFGKKFRFYIDGKQGKGKEIIEAELIEPFTYFGNEKEGNEHFGTICDLRVYEYWLNDKEVEKIAEETENVLVGLPDRFSEYINLANGVPALVKLLKNGIDFVKPYAMMVLANLATKETLRGTIIRSEGLHHIITLLHDSDEVIRQEAARALVNIS